MQGMNTGGGKTPLAEKVFRWLPVAGIAALVFYFWGLVSSFVLRTIEDTVWIVGYCLIGGLIWMNWTTLKLWYLGFAKKLSRLLVVYDPLAIMDGYLITLRKKFENLENVRLLIAGKKVKVERLIYDKEESYKANLSKARAAQKQGEEGSAKSFAFKAHTDKQAIDLYMPILQKYMKNSEFLNSLAENWKTSIDTLDYTIASKREEFENMKALFQGLKSAEDFINSDSDSARIYAESVKALEENVSQKIAYIEDFERKAKPIMTNMKVENQANEDEAMRLLENMLKQDAIKLPDYSTFTPVKQAETISINNKYNL